MRSIKQICFVVVMSIMFVAAATYAATTIGTNITTAGTLSVTGVTTVVNASSTLLSVSGNLWVNGYATTTGSNGNFATAGTLTASSTAQVTGAVTFYGDTTLGDANTDALTINAGAWTLGSSATSTVAMTKGVNFDSNTFVIDPNANRVGVLTATPNAAFEVVGTASTTSFIVGGNSTNGTVAGLVFGTCTVDFGTSLAAATASTTNCTATGVRTGDKVFVTPGSLENNIVFNSASTTAANTIQVQIFNATGTAAVTIASHTWSWMAIR